MWESLISPSILALKGDSIHSTQQRTTNIDNLQMWDGLWVVFFLPQDLDQILIWHSENPHRTMIVHEQLQKWAKNVERIPLTTKHRVFIRPIRASPALVHRECELVQGCHRCTGTVRRSAAGKWQVHQNRPSSLPPRHISTQIGIHLHKGNSTSLSKATGS